MVLTKPVRQSYLYDHLATVMGTPAGTTPAAVTAEPEARVATPAVRAAARAAGPRILLAEDNAINQTVALRMLQKLDYRTEVVANGREAVEAIAAMLDGHDSPYAAVLMDCQMPEMDGFAATAAIRALEGDARRTPIIAMTANALAGERERCLAAGMDDYIAKPVVLQRLRTGLERWAASPPRRTCPPRKDRRPRRCRRIPSMPRC